MIKLYYLRSIIRHITLNENIHYFQFLDICKKYSLICLDSEIQECNNRCRKKFVNNTNKKINK